MEKVSVSKVCGRTIKKQVDTEKNNASRCDL